MRTLTLPDSSGTSGLHTGRVAKTEIDSAGRSVGVVRQDSVNAAQTRVGFSYDGFSQLRSLIRTKNGSEKAHRTEYASEALKAKPLRSPPRSVRAGPLKASMLTEK